jgi:phage-related protein
VDQGGTQRFRRVSRGCQKHSLGCAHDRSRRRKGELAKPIHGFGSGVLEIALAYRGDAFRVVYAVQLADQIWVIHAFQKKSKQSIKTPKHEIDLVKDRLKRLKEALK